MQRIWLLWSSIALILCFVPLTNVLGYESSAVMAVVFALTIPLGTKEVSLELSHLFLDIQRFFLNSLPPLMILLLNGLRIQNCDVQTGLYFWCLLPIVTIGIMSILRLITGVLFSRVEVRFIYSLLLFEFLWFLWKLAWWPSIAGYSWTFGWFAGSIYDEALAVPIELIHARVFHLLTVVSGLSLSWVWRHKRIQIQTLLAPILWVAMFNASDELGLNQSTGFVQRELGGQFTTEHAIVYYSEEHLSSEDVQRLQWDIEFRYWELSEFFAVDPVQWKGRPIEIFVYPNTETQQRLMGSRRTLVARPWTHQMHIRWTFGSSVLAHEMAHLFTAPFGRWPLRLATIHNIIPNIGFVEGIAVAADWPSDPYSPHEIASVLFKEQQLPNLQNALTPWGFWRQSAGKAYQAMGSFVSWLIESYGIDKFKMLYQTFDFYEIYGKSSNDLLDEWVIYLDAIYVEEIHKKQILMMYQKKSIFQKMCARTVAETTRNFDKSIRNQHTGQVGKHYQRLIAWRPNDMNIHSKYLQYQLDIKEEIDAKILFDFLSSSPKDSDDYFSLQTIHIRSIVTQDSVTALDIVDEILSKPLVPRWRRHFLLMKFFILEGLSLNYFSKDWTVIERLAWLELQPMKPEIQYLQVRNWFISEQFDVVNSFSVLMELDAELVDEYQRILYQSALLTNNWTRLNLLKSVGVQPPSLEYERREQWLLNHTKH